jgi:small subunit ribosomal protein S20
MANIKSAKKAARKSEKRRVINLSRKTAIKTAIKKLIASIDKGGDVTNSETLLKEVTAKLARAQSKGVMHQRTASRKVSRLAKRVAAVQQPAAK